MSRRKVGIVGANSVGKRYRLFQKSFLSNKNLLLFESSFSSNKSRISLDSLYSSNKNLQVLDSLSCSSNKSRISLDSLYSSNKPGFIGCEINRGIDDELLKGGFRKI